MSNKNKIEKLAKAVEALAAENRELKRESQETACRKEIVKIGKYHIKHSLGEDYILEYRLYQRVVGSGFLDSAPRVYLEFQGTFSTMEEAEKAIDHLLKKDIDITVGHD